MIRTRVGYAGGTRPGPTYRDLGDHSEAVQIDFDPSRVTYEELLEVFWESHDPSARAWSRQYRAAVFTGGAEQERLARASKQRLEQRGRTVRTAIEPLGTFTRAEDYHQKYALQRHPDLAEELQARYPDFRGFVDSTAAARLNGFLGGHGTRAQLDAEIDGYGLSAAGRERLLRLAGRR